ncbi:hypothetical protein HQ544_05405 [Candidatus Falkowbacteria bacterium]|nr:hypothetical protein [Candidatus Falkowbacteria bacterium]
MEQIKVYQGVSHTYSPHTVEGTIRIVESPRDVSKVGKGDIIVIPTLGTGLQDFIAPIIIENAVAVVGMVGGALCHMAITMRELDRPCLLIDDAINKLTDGKRARIEVNTRKERFENEDEEKDEISLDEIRGNWLNKRFTMLLLKILAFKASKAKGPKEVQNASIFVYE